MERPKIGSTHNLLDLSILKWYCSASPVCKVLYCSIIEYVLKLFKKKVQNNHSMLPVVNFKNMISVFSSFSVSDGFSSW